MKKYLFIFSVFFATNVQAQTKDTMVYLYYDMPAVYDSIPKPDSAKIYWKKKVLYEALFNQEMKRINNLKNPKLTKKALRFQDSTIKYKLLLEKLKK